MLVWTKISGATHIYRTISTVQLLHKKCKNQSNSKVISACYFQIWAESYLKNFQNISTVPFEVVILLSILLKFIHGLPLYYCKMYLYLHFTKWKTLNTLHGFHSSQCFQAFIFVKFDDVQLTTKNTTLKIEILPHSNKKLFEYKNVHI